MYISVEKRKFLIISLTSAALLLLDILFILRPLINKAYDLKSQVVSIKNNIANLNKQISMLDSQTKKLGMLTTDKTNYEKKFPKEEEVPALLESLSTIAKRSSVDIIAVKPVKIEAKEQMEKIAGIFHEIPIEILAKGGYHQLGQFINRLENLDRFMEVIDIEIVRDNTTPRRHYLRLLVSTYILRM